VTATEQQLNGSPDLRIAQACRNEHRALITLDTDFADLRVYPPRKYAGLIVLRLRSQSKPYVLQVLRRLLTTFTHEPVEGRLWIVEEDRIRIRH
jgi:predicted nuclease of predicted toxin-antitoxin system